MARVEGIEGLDPASPGQQPADANDSPVQVWEEPGTGAFDIGSSLAPDGLDPEAPAGTGAGFTVDHRPDPDARYLAPSFAGSAEMLYVCSGTVATGDDGVARVALPEDFEALASEFRYQLTVLGNLAQAVVAEEIEDNAFTIRTDHPRVKVCWQVTGIRQADWAAAVPAAVAADEADQPDGPGARSAVAGNRLQALIQDDPVDDEELRQLLAGLPDRADASAAAARTRLKEQWGRVPDSIQEQLPDHRLGRPTQG
ncbi:hypothetical protein LVY72_04420 [Arthrobacter sp. I2-34]|uniref:Uncharacterized protein n=1 Tax=Arthrobacter hankyongi TaxID=2904801 RepID=A0ABS9L3G9_9MICC|nr:hypothetical protein [Arthrobacter hankyongi]MCG2621156.1 hypothetical protein [Arthrobacter hankyongi]